MDHVGEAASLCSTCGRPLDSHDRHVRFQLPDPVFDIPESERAERTWGNDVLLQVRDVGAFVRVLLPIHLTGGYAIAVGTWLAVHPDDLRRAWGVWWQPDYTDLRLDGYLANALPPWGREVLAKPATANVKDPGQVPYVTDSRDVLLARILHAEWPHVEILGALDV